MASFPEAIAGRREFVSSASSSPTASAISNWHLFIRTIWEDDSNVLAPTHLLTFCINIVSKSMHDKPLTSSIWFSLPLLGDDTGSTVGRKFYLVTSNTTGSHLHWFAARLKMPERKGKENLWRYLLTMHDVNQAYLLIFFSPCAFSGCSWKMLAVALCGSWWSSFSHSHCCLFFHYCFQRRDASCN